MQRMASVRDGGMDFVFRVLDFSEGGKHLRCGVTAYLLYNGPASRLYAARLSARMHGAGAKASLNRAMSCMQRTRNRVIYPWPG